MISYALLAVAGGSSAQAAPTFQIGFSDITNVTSTETSVSYSAIATGILVDGPIRQPASHTVNCTFDHGAKSIDCSGTIEVDGVTVTANYRSNETHPAAVNIGGGSPGGNDGAGAIVTSSNAIWTADPRFFDWSFLDDWGGASLAGLVHYATAHWDNPDYLIYIDGVCLNCW